MHSPLTASVCPIAGGEADQGYGKAGAEDGSKEFVHSGASELGRQRLLRAHCVSDTKRDWKGKAAINFLFGGAAAPTLFY
eukprot:5644765-Prymnesium_polylepis.1